MITVNNSTVKRLHDSTKFTYTEQVFALITHCPSLITILKCFATLWLCNFESMELKKLTQDG